MYVYIQSIFVYTVLWFLEHVVYDEMMRCESVVRNWKL